MAFTFPAVDDFKSQFVRDFPFAVPCFGAAGVITLAGGALASIAVAKGGQGYIDAPLVAVVDQNGGPGTGAVVTAAVAAGKVTGFVVGTAGANYVSPILVLSGGAGDNSDLTRVTDDDITSAIQDAAFNVNQALFGTQSDWAKAFLYLAAHNLVERLLAAGEGMRSRYNWLTNAKTAGDLSESYTIPDSILESPFLSSVSKTRYGARYLEIVSPLLIGNMGTFYRRSAP